MSALRARRDTRPYQQLDDYSEVELAATSAAPKEHQSSAVAGESSSAARISHEEPLLDERQGKPCFKSIITWVDVGALVVAAIAFAVSVIIVWVPRVALYLGQTSQLTYIGIAVTVMGRCAQRQVQLALVLYEIRFGASSLRNLEALLRNTAFAQDVALLPRASLVFLIALPIALGASYKQFSNDHVSVRDYPPGNEDWGPVAAPGLPISGNGISLAVNSYVPFWQNTEYGRTYGYNLLVPSNTTAALLDAPFPAFRTYMQQQTVYGQYVLLNVTVNATVSENVDLTPSQQNDRAFWEGLDRKGYGTYDKDLSYGFDSRLRVQQHNASDIFISIWDRKTENPNSTAQRFMQRRQRCWGQWNITATNITLVQAQLLGNEKDPHSLPDQRLIRGANGIGAANDVGRWFSELIPEYNYKWYPRPGVDGANAYPALVASMVWGRIISAVGAEKNNVPQPLGDATRQFVRYTKPPKEMPFTWNVIALQRSGWLMFVLLINLILTLLATVFKAALYATPVDEGFGIIALLAGVQKESLDVLRGAALSGQLKRDVRAKIHVEDNKTEHGGEVYRPITIQLDGSGRSEGLERKEKYG